MISHGDKFYGTVIAWEYDPIHLQEEFGRGWALKHCQFIVRPMTTYHKMSSLSIYNVSS